MKAPSLHSFTLHALVATVLLLLLFATLPETWGQTTVESGGDRYDYGHGHVEIHTRLGRPPETVIRTPMRGGTDHYTHVPGEDQGMKPWATYEDLRRAQEISPPPSPFDP